MLQPNPTRRVPTFTALVMGFQPTFLGRCQQRCAAIAAHHNGIQCKTCWWNMFLTSRSSGVFTWTPARHESSKNTPLLMFGHRVTLPVVINYCENLYFVNMPCFVPQFTDYIYAMLCTIVQSFHVVCSYAMLCKGWITLIRNMSYCSSSGFGSAH